MVWAEEYISGIRHLEEPALSARSTTQTVQVILCLVIGIYIKTSLVGRPRGSIMHVTFESSRIGEGRLRKQRETYSFPRSAI